MNAAAVPQPKISTFRQYVQQARQAAARKHGITLTEAARELPEHIYIPDWENHVVSTFNNGADIPTALWRSLGENLQRRILRSPRALRDDTLTRTLREKTATPA